MTPARPLLAALALLAAPAALADERDPVELLREAAAAAQAPESATFDFAVSTKLVRDEQADEMKSTFRYRTAPGGRFDFQTVPEEGELNPGGYLVAGNPDVMMTAVVGRRRHMLEAGADGFASFIRSPAAMSIGSGLGGLALAVVHPAAVEDLIGNLVDSEFVGVEEVNGEQLLHARYTVQGDIKFDAWFNADGAPLVRRVTPDVLSTPGVQAMARRFENFDYQLNFDFADWNTAAALSADDIPVAEPNGSILMASLYERPAPGPHALLGREAPVVTLPTAAGDEVNLAETFGKNVVLIEFWATNCPYCIQAMPELEKLEADYAEQGVKYYAVNVGESAEEVAAFLEAQEIGATSLIDEEREMTNAYDVGPIPLILVVGLDGKVQSATEGFSPTLRQQLATQIDAVLDRKDLAGAQLAEWKSIEEQRTAERNRLRSLLDG